MKGLLTTLLCLFMLNCTAQYAPGNSFKTDFKRQMLKPVPHPKPQLSFEQRDVIHTHVAGGALATIGIPVVTASILGLNSDNQNMAVTGLVFGGSAVVGSIVLHALGINKLIRYKKAGKLPNKKLE